VEAVAVGVDEHVEDEVKEEEGRDQGVVEGVLAQEVGQLGVACGLGGLGRSGWVGGGGSRGRDI
jgi:hypothetical protein